MVKSHKEQREDEEFVGNANLDELNKLLAYGIDCRLGNKAYYIDGKEIESNYLKPLFVKKSNLKKYDNKMRKESGFTIRE